MADAVNIQEFLVSLGFSVNESQYKKFRDGLGSVRKEVIEFGLALTAAAVAVDVLVSKTARQFEGLFYASQRTGESVKNIGALEYAFKMTGLSADQARGMIETFQKTLRLNPGAEGLLKALGVADGSPADRFTSLITKLGKLPPYQAAGYGQPFGIDEPTLRQITNNLPTFLKSIDEFRATQEKAGINSEKLAKESAEYERAMTRLTNSLDTLRQILAEEFLPTFTKLVDWLNSIFDPESFRRQLDFGRNPAPGTDIRRSFDRWFGKKTTNWIFGEEPATGVTSADMARVNLSDTHEAGAPGGTVERSIPGIMRFFHDAGYSWQAAAGIAANIHAENASLDPSLAHLDSNGRYSYGLGQWNSPDRTAEFKGLYGHDISKGTFEEQLGFFLHEMSKGSDVLARQAGIALKREGITAGESGWDFSRLFERPADMFGQSGARARTAEDYFRRFGNQDDRAPVMYQPTTNVTINGAGAGSTHSAVDSLLRNLKRIHSDQIRYLRNTAQ
jgi:hypothetical protein